MAPLACRTKGRGKLTLNGLFQAAKRKTRGYQRLSTIRTVTFLLAGKIDYSRLNPHAG